MKKIRRGIALAMLFVLCVQVLFGCGSRVTTPQRTTNIDLSGGFQVSPEEGELTKVNENDRFVLLVNFSNGQAAVEDKKNGKTWYTNPVDAADDEIASGSHKSALRSVISVKYVTDLDVEMSCMGYLASVSRNGLSYRVEDDGSVIFLFDFPKEEFLVPVRYAIGDDYFTAEILSDNIYEYGTNDVLMVDLLPYFGAGGLEDTGFMLVPDGSGALIYYDNHRLTAASYGNDTEQKMYGGDDGATDWTFEGHALRAAFVLRENQYLPVFGVSQNDQGFLAVITEGAARSGIRANVARKYTSYNTVWSSYNYRYTARYQHIEKDAHEENATISERRVENWQNYAVRFYFLDRGSNQYTDMAKTYRDYLIANEGLQIRVTEQENIPLYLDLYGYIEKTKSFAGIPTEAKIATTTISDANEILDDLEESGIKNVVLKYNYWAKNSFFDKVPITSRVDGKVGDAKQMLALQERLSDNGGALYLSADLINVYKTGNGVGKLNGVLRSVGGSANRQYAFNALTLAIDERYDPWYLIRPTVVSETFDKFVRNMTKAGYENLALDTVGEKLYSELSTSGIGRNWVRQIMNDAVGSVSEQANVMVTGANEYAAVYATHILQTPSSTSNYDLTDEAVPFYQMVFHGYASYSLPPVNLSSNPTEITLKHLEYGASPMYSLTARNIDELIGSRMDRLYSADVSIWMDYMAKQYEQINAVLRGVQTSTITDHRILSENVRAVEYSNGTTIYVNYGSEAAQAEGIRIQPMGFAVTVNGVETINTAIVSAQ